MKKYFKYVWAIVLASTIGCSDFGNTNVSPNGSSVPLTSALLTNGLAAIGGAAGANGVGVTAGLYCQYFSQTLYTDASRYSLQDINWTELSGSMYDFQNIININSDPATAVSAAVNGANNNQIAIARIMKAIRFSILTDRYGDMPYSEALTGIPNPKFDTQEFIYNDIFNELKDAAAQLDNTPPTVKGDILFGGDINRWKQYANSWRLILALRVSKVPGTLGKDQFTDVISNLGTNGGVLETADDDITITYPGNATEFYNPWYALGGDQNISLTIADFINNNGDDRRFAFATSVNGTTVGGFPYGLARDDAAGWANSHTDHSLIMNTTYRGIASNLTLLTAGDILLARAEAAFLGWTAEDYTVLYPEGIKQSWEHWGQDTSGANFTNYMAKQLVDLASGSSSVAEKIGTQRWISFYPNGPQGWAEWRRTGFPVLTKAPVPLSTSGEIPVRFIYPTGEYGLNPVGVKAAVALLEKGDTPDSHVWWDK